MSSKAHMAYVIAIVALIATAVIVARAWADHVREEARRDARLEQDKSEIAQREQALSALEQKRDTELAAKDAEIAKVKRDAQAAQQTLLQAYAAAGQSAPNVVSAAQAQALKDLPDAPMPGDLVLDKAQQQAAAEFKLRCDKCSTSLRAAQAENDEKDRIIALKDDQLKAALKAAKGGSVWQRTFRVARDLVCSGAGAGVGAAAGGTKGAIAGAVGVGLTCHVLGR